jgi:DNA-binding transcriptional LysR family regulator
LQAAKLLGVSQPTVARRIDVLEHTLQLVLFERGTRGFRPTQDALNLKAAAEAVEAAIGTFIDDAQNSQRIHFRPIKITAPPKNFSDTFAKILAEFSAAHPGAHFEFISTYAVLDLSAGEADVAIRIAQKIDDDTLICRKLNTIRPALYASTDYAARHGLPASAEALDGHKFVVYDRLAKSYGLNEWLLERIDPSQIASRCSDTEAMIAAIKIGIGIGILTPSLANDDPTLKRCFRPPENTSTSSWLLINRDAYRRPEVKAFSAFFAPRYQAAFKNYTQS